jgi:TolB-like protein/cytochrome c-type biogenesis protein CcmH/NrfG
VLFRSPKRGYRLLAEVVVDRSVDSPLVAGIPPASLPSSAQPRWRRYALWAVLLALAGSLGVLRLQDKPAASLTSTASRGLAVHITPFTAVDATPESQLLAAGLSSELVGDLSRLPALQVITASSLGVAPQVRYRVTGDVQHLAGRVRIHVHLVDANLGQAIWSERFDRPLGDLFELQSELSHRLLALLPVKLDAAERQRVARRYTRSLAAYDLFLRAQATLLTRSPADNETARALYRQAIRSDPAFARAYAGLALTYAADYRNQWVAKGSDALARAFEMAETARQIDPDIPQIYWVLGYVHAQRRQHDQALAQLARAVRLNPSYADAYALMGGIHTYLGRPAESLPLLRTAQRLNPEAGYLYYLLLGRAYYFLNDHEQARINLAEALARNAVNLEAHVFLAATLAEQGDMAGAAWELEEIHGLQPNFQVTTWLQTYPLASAALQTRLGAALGRIDR